MTPTNIELEKLVALLRAFDRDATTLHDAATAIESLQADIVRLRSALEALKAWAWSDEGSPGLGGDVGLAELSDRIDAILQPRVEG